MPDLCAGILFKLEEAGFFREKMSRVLVPGSIRQNPYAYYMASTIVVPRWAPDFYYYFDAFLAAARSGDYVIGATFGVDRVLQSWIDTLPLDEQKNRMDFKSQYDGLARTFRDHLLSHVRSLSIHRAGSPSVEVTVNGRWGMVYSGGPTSSLPTTEQRPFVRPDDPNVPVGWMQLPDLPLEPREDDFTVTEFQPDGTTRSHKLFPACNEYLQLAQSLKDAAMTLANQVHKGQPVTPPPLYEI